MYLYVAVEKNCNTSFQREEMSNVILFPSERRVENQFARLVCHLRATEDQKQCPAPAEHEHAFMSTITQDVSLRLITDWKRVRT